MAIDREMLLKFLQFFCLQQLTAMGKAIQRKIEFFFKRKRDDISENEDVVPPTNDTLSLLEVEHQPSGGLQMILCPCIVVHIEGDLLKDYNYDDVISDFKSIKNQAADL
jgi:hypothetical protein